MCRWIRCFWCVFFWYECHSKWADVHLIWGSLNQRFGSFKSFLKPTTCNSLCIHLKTKDNLYPPNYTVGLCWCPEKWGFYTRKQVTWRPKSLFSLIRQEPKSRWICSTVTVTRYRVRFRVCGFVPSLGWKLMHLVACCPTKDPVWWSEFAQETVPAQFQYPYSGWFWRPQRPPLGHNEVKPISLPEQWCLHFHYTCWGWLRGPFVCIRCLRKVLCGTNTTCSTAYLQSSDCLHVGEGCNTSVFTQPAPHQSNSATCCPFKPNTKVSWAWWCSHSS